MWALWNRDLLVYSYLSYRFKCIKRTISYSSWNLVKGGILQGNTLGCLLILIYMDGMSSQVVYGRLLQYAEDTALICTDPNYQ